MAEAEVGDMQPEYAGEEPAEQAGEARSAEAEDVHGAGGGMSASAREAEAAAQETGQAAEAAGEEAPVRAAEGVQETREVPKSAEEPKVYDGRAHLKDYQLDLFRGFIGIGSLEEQIANAIRQAEGKQGDRTSRTGNILILGAHGCGKTTIATGIAKAIAEDTGTHSIKMARIYAADLNRKDIAATIAKIAGGVLIVEEAGDLDDAIVDQLTTAMEFRTDGLIMILEDEQRYIHDLLMRHPRFTMKFTAQIYIPEYTNEELVNFGRIYAESKDYVFSDRALEALCDRVEAAAQNGDAVSVTNIIELVDRGIRNANKFFRRIGSAKKRYDEMDRVILKEKDFR
jgi:energy-coupling factor transporter ATP-binding protein EcfA2